MQQHQMRRFKNRNEKKYEGNEDPMSNIYLNWEKKLQVMQMCRVKFWTQLLTAQETKMTEETEKGFFFFFFLLFLLK